MRTAVLEAPTAGPAAAPPAARRPRLKDRPARLALLAAAVTALVWLGLPDLAVEGRLALTVFALAVVAWTLTSVDDTWVALAAAVTLPLIGADEAQDLFAALGNSTVWLLLAAFVVAGAVTRTGLAARLAVLVSGRARTVQGLFRGLTLAVLATAFVIPATSGRAALLVPVFLGLATALKDRRVVRALALLLPSVVLLSAAASLLGAGAHLITSEVLRAGGYDGIGYLRWLVLGLPFALVSCLLTCEVVLRMFLTAEERTRRLDLATDGLSTDGAGRGPLSAGEKRVLAVVGGLVVLWSTEPLHGVDVALVALVGALLVMAPRVGVLTPKEGFRAISWPLLVFLAATLALGEALSETGAAQVLVDGAFSSLGGVLGGGALPVVALVAAVSLLSHLVITSRTARATVLVPLVVLLAVALGLDPVTLAFVSTVGAGFCHTLPVSAKPVAMFSSLDVPTYEPRDLTRLSAVLLPLHLVLLLVFTFTVWPLLGLSATRTASAVPPQAPDFVASSAVALERARAERLAGEAEQAEQAAQQAALEAERAGSAEAVRLTAELEAARAAAAAEQARLAGELAAERAARAAAEQRAAELAARPPAERVVVRTVPVPTGDDD
jgi:solute carrier family 13 (sodium-dependent dicarboxylate transporter), member 2/3/5